MKVTNGAIETPFNLEAILGACPVLLAEWMKRPFIIDLTKEGLVTIIYLEKIL